MTIAYARVRAYHPVLSYSRYFKIPTPMLTGTATRPKPRTVDTTCPIPAALSDAAVSATEMTLKARRAAGHIIHRGLN
jgi:hypothetical protein